MSRVRISRLDSNRDNAPRGVDVEWAELAQLLGAGGVAPSPCTVETCGRGEFASAFPKKVGGGVVMVPKEGPKYCRFKYGAAWSPAVYPPGATRANRNVGVVSLLVVDLDHLTDDQLDAAGRPLQPYRYVAHPSHGDRPGDRCWRVVVALSEPVLAADWPRFWAAAMAMLGQPADESCCDAARLYFLPTRRSDAPDGQVEVHEGAPVDVRAVLASAPPRAPSRELSDAGDLPPASPAVLERCRQRLRDHGPAVEGSGGDRWTFSACAALVHGYALTEAEAWPLLLEWNEACEPPWDPDELRVKLENAASYASGPRGGERLQWEAAEGLRSRLTAGAEARSREAESRGAADYGETDWGDAPAEEDEPPEPGEGPGAFDHAAALGALRAAARGEVLAAEHPPGFAGDVARALDEVAAELGGDVEGAAQDLEPLFEHASVFFERDDEPPPMLVRGLLRAVGVGSFGAGPKASKTWCATECMCAVATGTPAFGAARFGVERPRSVAYYFAEDDRTSVKAHLRALASGRGIRVEELIRNMYLRPMGRRIDLRSDRDLALILASCRQVPSLGLLVIDPLRDVHSGKENESDDMADVLGRLRFLARKLQCMVLVPHHAKKLSREEIAGGEATAGAALRGSSVIFGALDSLVMLARDEKAGDECHICVDARAIVKGAKSGGAFALRLTIVDDERDLARHAQWEYRSGAEKRADDATEAIGEARAADHAVTVVEAMRLIELRKEPPRNNKQLRQIVGGGMTALTAALAWAEGKGWVHKPNVKWELTDAGRSASADVLHGRE
jgi:hypothetical protein